MAFDRLSLLLPAVFAAAASFGSLAPASAQVAQTEVRGSVVQADQPVPVQGAMVLLLDASGFLRGRVLSGRDGSFRLVAPQPGTYQLRVDRIGFESTFSERFPLAAGQSFQITIETDYQPIDLPGLLAEGSRRCEVRPTRGAAAAAWDEARKALEAAAWTAERGYYRFVTTRFVREIAEDGRRVLRQEESVRADLAATPFKSIPADTLAKRGFVVDEGRDVSYAAPDAVTLVSDAFLDTHCFELERREVEGERLIGLRFSPVPGRRLPDVTGVLWLGELTGLLRSIEYNYVNLPWQISLRDAGGEIRLTGLPNGTWIVREWTIRMPRVAEERDEVGRVRAHRVLGYMDEGGIVNQVAATNGEVVPWDTGLGTIAGVVSDSTGRPASGALVRVEGTDFLAETDRSGRFSFEDVAAGVWTVSASSDAHARLGLSGASRDVEVARDATGNVALALPSVRAAAIGRCGLAVADSITVLLGRVLDANGRPVPRASVRATWTERPQNSDPNVQQLLTSWAGAALEADDVGRFAVCGFPTSRAVRLVAVSGELTSERVETSVRNPSQIATVEVRLGAGAPATAPAVAGAPPRALSAEDQWLAGKGYARRAGYALLQQTRRQFSSVRRDSLRYVLEQVPRIEAFERVDGGYEYRLHSSSQWSVQAGPPDYCVLDLYLNGSRIQPGIFADLADYVPRADGRLPILDRSALSIDRWLDLRLVTAVEVFDAPDVPAGTGVGCGAAFVWMHYLDDADDPEFNGFLRGRVTGLTGAQLAGGVPVTAQPGGLKASLDRFGRFDFGALTAARYQVEIALPDWGTWRGEAMVRAGDVVDLSVEVATLRDTTGAVPASGVPGAPAGVGGATPESAIPLAGIEVTAAARIRFLEREGFYQRQRDGVGVFLTPEEIARRPNTDTRDLISSLPGISLFDANSTFSVDERTPCPGGWRKADGLCVADGGGPRAPMLLTRAGLSTFSGIPCSPAVYVDTTLVQPSGEDPNGVRHFDIRTVPLSQVLAVEVFRSTAEVPVRFSGGSSACGVIVIWTLASVPPA